MLGKTLGVPLFQEQAMRLAMVAAKFTADEANELRRAMATFRNVGTIQTVRGTDGRAHGRARLRRGTSPQRCFEQIKGFGTYGFPESHAASFAKLVYVSSWIKCHHPAVFACALLIRSRWASTRRPRSCATRSEHGVEVRPVDVNHSVWDNTLERDEDGRAGAAARLPADRRLQRG